MNVWLGISPPDRLDVFRSEYPRARVEGFRAAPFPEVLFRPEEVVLASSAAPVHHRVVGRDARNLPVVRLQVDAFGAVGAGVVQLDAVVLVLAVDQQQKVDGSRYAELLIIVQCHGMERETQAFKKPGVVIGQRVTLHGLTVWERQEAEPTQHLDSVGRLFGTDADRGGDVIRRWQV